MAEEDALLAFQHECGLILPWIKSRGGPNLWDSLEAKHMAKDASSKKFLVSNFTNYKMTNSRPVMEQYNELLGINDEMNFILGNKTWVLADLPLGCKPLGCKWVLKRKLNVDGTIKKLKARLVIQGFRQKSGIGYFDNYAPVTTFLNGEFDEEEYMNQPQGFIMHGNENKVDLTKEFLSSKFTMKDIWEVNVILVSTPMDTSEKLMLDNNEAVSQLEYSRMIGCLMYAMTCTRPDIAFAMGKLSRRGPEFTWEHEDQMQKKYPHLFLNSAPMADSTS
uniref:Reverse transcriptase Ty1/copia-type domain-containing protein n=1 Tax=Tanacetum cinerariifolium TaxID=118510 RepID=A0A6L2M1M1_TANCI|nr:hypothetical protein [Tanacetum cinerariifolium]